MVDYFLGEDLPAEALGKAQNATDILHWAKHQAQQAGDETIFRNKEGRKTLRCELAGRGYFLKLHSGVGVAEIVKNLLQARLPVVDARNEYLAVNALRALGIETLTIIAFAAIGTNPATRESMILSEELSDTISLEDYCRDWPSRPPSTRDRVRLLRKVALIARQMHAAGINHRDFYLCHFHLEPASLGSAAPRCYLIDLHRAQIREEIPSRWREKDLAGLYYSAMDIGLSQRDLLRFMHLYTPGGIRKAFEEHRAMWLRVEARALRLYRKVQRKRA